MLLLVTCHLSPVTVFRLAFALFSLYHVTLHVFVRISVQKQQVLRHFYILLIGRVSSKYSKSAHSVEENDSCLAINSAGANRIRAGSAG